MSCKHNYQFVAMVTKHGYKLENLIDGVGKALFICECGEHKLVERKKLNRTYNKSKANSENQE